MISKIGKARKTLPRINADRRGSGKMNSNQQSDTNKRAARRSTFIYQITRLLNYQIQLRFSDPIHERLELARARWMSQFTQRLGFNLSDAFTSYGERLAHFFKSVLR